MTIEVPNTDPILDPAWARARVTQSFEPALAALGEIVAYGVDLLKRTLHTGPDDLPHHLILSVLLRQVIVSADGVRELANAAASDAAQVQVRSLMEARWGLMLALHDPNRWGRHLYVAYRREQLSQIQKSIPNTAEHAADVETRELIEKYGGQSTVSAADAVAFQESIEFILRKPENQQIAAGFEAYSKEKRHEPPWYYDPALPKKERITSIWKLAFAVGAAGEYKSIYRQASYFVHGGYGGTHLLVDEKGTAVMPVRSPVGLRHLLLLTFSLVADACARTIDHWRPDERTAFTRKYVEQWREVIRQMPDIELELGEAVNWK